MKEVTNKFKENIKLMGRQIDFFITYTLENKEYLLDSQKLISITPHFSSNILKSVMKQLEFETTEKIPKGTIVNAK